MSWPCSQRDTWLSTFAIETTTHPQGPRVAHVRLQQLLRAILEPFNIALALLSCSPLLQLAAEDTGMSIRGYWLSRRQLQLVSEVSFPNGLSGVFFALPGKISIKSQLKIGQASKKALTPN